MRSRLAFLTLALPLLAACTTTTAEEIERVCAYIEDPGRACTDACAEALRATDCTDEWDRVRELDANIEGCLISNCTSNDTCDGSRWNCACYAACVAEESPDVQQAVLTAIHCATPDDCR